jgi:hypothetical protein
VGVALYNLHCMGSIGIDGVGGAQITCLTGYDSEDWTT